jgi:hypothetical protein
MYSHLKSLTLLVLALILLPGCEGVRKQFGMGKSSPDEFRVVSRAPLTMPPDFGLRPPDPGAVRANEGTATNQARQAVFKIEQGGAEAVNEAMAADGRSLGERAVLLAAGVDATSPDIRQVVDAETNRINAESEDFLKRLIWWSTPDETGVVVDAEGEAKRLQENAALGRSVSEGETPVIERKERALLEF